jgi:hypothetical protein
MKSNTTEAKAGCSLGSRFLLKGLAALLFLQNSWCFAEQRAWPDYFRLPEFFAISPWGLEPYTYAHHQGLGAWGEEPLLSHYDLTLPARPWTQTNNRDGYQPHSCNQSEREGGYLHTLPISPITFTQPRAHVAVPFLLSLRAPFQGQRKELLMNSTFLTISLLRLDPEAYQLEVHREFHVTLRDLCALDPGCAPSLLDSRQPFHLNYDQSYLTPEFDFPRDMPLRVKVKWFTQALCNEESLDFMMSQEIRIYEAEAPARRN